MGTKQLGVLLYIPLIVTVGLRDLSSDLVSEVLWKKDPRDQEETDLDSRLTSQPRHCGQVI